VESYYQTEKTYSYSRCPIDDDDDSLDEMFTDAETFLTSADDIYLMTLFPDPQTCLDNTSEGKLSVAAALDVSLDAVSRDALSLDTESLDEVSLCDVSWDTQSLDAASLDELSLDGPSLDELPLDDVSQIEFLFDEQKVHVNAVVSEAVRATVGDMFDAISSSKSIFCIVILIFLSSVHLLQYYYKSRNLNMLRTYLYVFI
jgi:hypothetical protein